MTNAGKTTKCTEVTLTRRRLIFYFSYENAFLAVVMEMEYILKTLEAFGATYDIEIM